jgi:hypothetical protein
MEPLIKLPDFHIPSMQDLTNPQKWSSYLSSLTNINVAEIYILFFIVGGLFVFFFWEYLKSNEM